MLSFYVNQYNLFVLFLYEITSVAGRHLFSTITLLDILQDASDCSDVYLERIYQEFQLLVYSVLVIEHSWTASIYAILFQLILVRHIWIRLFWSDDVQVELFIITTWLDVHHLNLNPTFQFQPYHRRTFGHTYGDESYHTQNIKAELHCHCQVVYVRIEIVKSQLNRFAIFQFTVIHQLFVVVFATLIQLVSVWYVIFELQVAFLQFQDESFKVQLSVRRARVLVLGFHSKSVWMLLVCTTIIVSSCATANTEK